MPDTSPPAVAAAPQRKLAGPELIVMVAALMATNALSIDVMLPALPDISESLNVTTANDRQLVIVLYLMAGGFAQLIYGPLADSFGRRRVYLTAMCFYLVGVVVNIMAPTFTILLAGRIIQGLSVAAASVVAMALVRDMFAGPRMAQVMSTVMTVFLIVPIIAPALGQLVLLVAPWRWIFGLLLVYGIGVSLWYYFRAPETLAPENRVPFRLGSILKSFSFVLKSRLTIGYALAQTMIMSSFFGFLASSQQILGETFNLGEWFPFAFAPVAGMMAIAQLTNARQVMRYGMRPLAHTAAICYAVIAVAHALHAHFVTQDLVLFMLFFLPAMFTFGFIGANCGAIAMEPMGHIAGSAASLTGFFSMVTGAFIGGLLGRAYDGTVVPFLDGRAILAVLGLVVIVITERGRLFYTQPAPENPAT